MCLTCEKLWFPSHGMVAPLGLHEPLERGWIATNLGNLQCEDSLDATVHKIILFYFLYTQDALLRFHRPLCACLGMTLRSFQDVVMGWKVKPLLFHGYHVYTKLFFWSCHDHKHSLGTRLTKGNPALRMELLIHRHTCGFDVINKPTTFLAPYGSLILRHHGTPQYGYLNLGSA